jgi:hypothetical protein
MPITLKDLIETKDKYPDDRQISVPIADGDTLTITLGELRARERSIHGDVALREDAVAKLLAAAAEPPAAPAPVEQPRPNPAAYDYDSDPLFAPIAKRLLANEQANAQLLEQIKQLSQGTTQQVAAAIDLEQRNAFAARASEFPGVDYEQAIRYAAENHVVNKRGILDPLRAANELSAPARAKADKDAAFEAGKKAREKELQDAIVAQGIPMISLPGFSRNPVEGKAFKADARKSLESNLRAGLADGFSKVFGRTAAA